jgi:hypothetical protein
LRCHWDVSFLGREGSVSTLYEVQFSCEIIGRDSCSWTAYRFVDTYFEEAANGKETVDSYDEFRHLAEGMWADPATCGETDMQVAPHDPKGYFLMVFRYRIELLCAEMEQVVKNVKKGVEEGQQVRVFLYEHVAIGQHLLWLGTSILYSSL